MALLNPNASLLPMEEVLPAGLKISGLSRSSVITQRRRVRVSPQTGINYGANPPTSSNNAQGAQIQFVVSDAGGLLDPASIVVVYNEVVVATTGPTTVVPDDGHPFYRAQISLNGQLLDDVQQAGKYTNAEVALSASEAWYKTTGSMCGFELLNNDLQTGAQPSSTVLATALTQTVNYSGAWGDVNGNIPQINARYTQAGAAWNPLGGQQRALPLGLVSGVGRMRNLLPLNVLGELQVTLYAMSNTEHLVNTGGGSDSYYSLRGVYLEYDICVPHPAYAQLLAKVATDPQETGIALPYESVIMATSGLITGTASASGSLTDNSIIVSRATNNLVRSFLVQQQTNLTPALAFPTQSAFSHAGTNKIQWRIGSTYYPGIPAEGDASMFAMSQLAYGSADLNENNGIINRVMWAQNSLTYSSVNTANGSYVTSATTSGTEGFVKFCGADRFVPAYGFQMVKGHSEPIDLDGVSLSGASGSQAVIIVTSAPYSQVTPLVALIATRVIHAHGGQVRVQGA